MTERIQRMREFFAVHKEHHRYRQKPKKKQALAERYEKENAPELERAVGRVHEILEREIPVVFPGERIALMRTVPETPDLYTEAEYEELRMRYWIHESGDFNNFCPDYARIIGVGFDAIQEEIAASRQKHENDREKQEFLAAMLDMVVSLSSLAERYRKKAEEEGNACVAQTFAKIPKQPAETLLEAMQFVRLLNFGLWCANHYQCALGRMDQILYPYYKKDMEAGLYDREGILELVEEFFLGFNRDSDLYDGIQQGDNGQSLVLGGLGPDGSDSYNELSELMLEASLELKLIDPKINLRVSKHTPLERLAKATELTRQGLGFPQYLNDDVNIPALLDWGYEKEDAYGYAAAACWELLIPCRGTEIVNAAGLNFPAAVLEAVHTGLKDCRTYESFERAVCERVRSQAHEICNGLRRLHVFSAPMASFMMEGCIENGRDAAQGCRYQNIGIHGAGVSTAADSMSAIRKFVYETKEISAETLCHALETNFEETLPLKNKLRFDAPKMGKDKGAAEPAKALLNAFADALAEKRTETGGIFRPGTATAMYYLWFGRKLGATPDGRSAGEALPANYSPSLFARLKGPVSVVQAFTEQNLKRVANGGPLTLELHDSVFHAPDSVEKVAQLVRLFILRGGHQLQINAVNREDMLLAQRHPEEYRGMIVRVWGWSGYFVELDREYQDQIIQRTEFTL